MNTAQLEARRTGIAPIGSGMFTSLGDFALTVARAATTAPGTPEWAHSHDRLHQRLGSGPAGASEQVPADGGFLVYPDFAKAILLQTYNTGQLLASTLQVPITKPGANAVKIPAPDEQSRATGSRFGGVQGYWKNEGESPSTSKPKFRLSELTLKKLIAEVIVTDELLQDVAALDSWLIKILGLELAFLAEAAIVNGTGAGQPMGILKSPSLLTIAKQGGQSAATIVSENIEAMLTRIWDPMHEAMWIADPSTKGQLIAMSKTVSSGGSVSQYYRFASEPGQPDMLAGYPIWYPEYCSILGTPGDLILINPSRYAWACKDPAGAVSMHLRFLTDESVFRLVWRVDGQPIDNTVITPFNGGSTLSPYVALAQR